LNGVDDAALFRGREVIFGWFGKKRNLTHRFCLEFYLRGPFGPCI
jgi:hypothetical protein